MTVEAPGKSFPILFLLIQELDPNFYLFARHFFHSVSGALYSPIVWRHFHLVHFYSYYLQSMVVL